MCRPLHEGVDWNRATWKQACNPNVALFTRAWIEIAQRATIHIDTWSPSSRGRGLKWQRYGQKMVKNWSPSSRGRGLKYNLKFDGTFILSSPSSRGRGLKFSKYSDLKNLVTVALFTRAWIEISDLSFSSSSVLSPSSRGRGLKSLSHSFSSFQQQVALFTRAWIEISGSVYQRIDYLVALFTRAWIEIVYLRVTASAESRPLHEGVDWNNDGIFWINNFVVALFTRAWIEIDIFSNVNFDCFVALFTRAWIEIFAKDLYCPWYLVALFTRAWIEIHNYHIVFTWVWCRPLHEGVDWNKGRRKPSLNF